MPGDMLLVSTRIIWGSCKKTGPEYYCFAPPLFLISLHAIDYEGGVALTHSARRVLLAGCWNRNGTARLDEKAAVFGKAVLF